MIDHYGWQFRFRSRLHGSTSMTSRAVPSGRRPAMGRVHPNASCEGVTISATAVEPSASVVGEYGTAPEGQLLGLHGNARWRSLRG